MMEVDQSMNLRLAALLSLLSVLFMCTGLHLYLNLHHFDEKLVELTVPTDWTPVGASSPKVEEAVQHATVLPADAIASYSTSISATGIEKPYDEPFVIPGLTAMTSAGYTATASSTAPGYFPHQAFDKTDAMWIPDGGYNTVGKYAGTTTTALTDSTGTTSILPGEWVQLQVPAAFTIIEYSLSFYGPFDAPDWTLAASNDGVSWKKLDAVSANYLPPNKPTTDIFAVQHYLGSFTYFRLVLHTMNSEYMAGTQIKAPYVQEVSLCGLPQAWAV